MMYITQVSILSHPFMNKFIMDLSASYSFESKINSDI